MNRYREGDDRSWHAKAVPGIYVTIRNHFDCGEITEIGTPGPDQRDFDVSLDGSTVVAIRINMRPKNSGELNFFIGDVDIPTAFAKHDYLWMGWPGVDQRFSPNVHDYLIGDMALLRMASREAGFHYDRDSNCITTIKLVSLPDEFVLHRGVVTASTERSARCTRHPVEKMIDVLLPNGMIRSSCGVCSVFLGLRPKDLGKKKSRKKVRKSTRQRSLR